MHDEREVDPSN